MNATFKRHLTSLTVGLLLMSTGCLYWDPGWKVEAPEGSAVAEAQELQKEANSYEKMAGSADSLEHLSHIYAELLKADPAQAGTWWLGLGRARLLLGAGFARSIGEKGEFYREGLEALERSMASSADFMAAYEGIDDIDEFPLGALTSAHGIAARLWSIGVILYVDECMSELVKLTNSNYLDAAAGVAMKMAEIDGPMDRGFGPLIKGVVTSLKSKDALFSATQLFDQAFTAEPNSALFHWARARFLYVQHHDGPHAEKDLRFVIDSDPDSADGGYLLNAYLQANAKALVEKVKSPMIF